MRPNPARHLEVPTSGPASLPEVPVGSTPTRGAGANCGGVASDNAAMHRLQILVCSSAPRCQVLLEAVQAQSCSRGSAESVARGDPTERPEGAVPEAGVPRMWGYFHESRVSSALSRMHIRGLRRAAQMCVWRHLPGSSRYNVLLARLSCPPSTEVRDLRRGVSGNEAWAAPAVSGLR